ncbi:hypothetical protein [Lapillicoccus sp.]|uniref:hypothetical protein n=1 Tax=Lapillicoccus sp. TaxID=1909287 RepID=UPI0025E4D082|nr:hypothetical protein [Lapillicoccus sp.]
MEDDGGRPFVRQVALDCAHPRPLAESYRGLLGDHYRPGDDADVDVAIAPAIYDVYGPSAVENTANLTAAMASRFGTRATSIATYRSAYALATAGCFGSGPEDGHFAWCVQQLSAVR